jgi:hypothetical protein
MTQNISASEYRRALVRQLSPLGVVPTQFTADITLGSATLANPSSTLDLSVGDVVSGMGIADGAKITAIDSAAPSVTLDTVAIASGTTVVLSAVPNVAVTVHLYKSPASPGPEPTPDSFTECDFDGYSSVVFTLYIGPYTSPAGEATYDCEKVSWILSSDPSVSNNVYGYWIDYGDPSSSGPKTVMLWEPFLTPLPMAAAGNGVIIVVPLQMPDPGTVDVVG